MKTPRQKVTTPKGLTGRTFTVDGKELFKALSKGALHLAQTKWEDVASDALDAISAVGIGTEPTALAHVLLRRAAIRALFELVAETVKSTVYGARPYEATMAKALEKTIASHDITIDQNFFERPMELPLVAGLQDLLGRWLQLLAVPSHEITSLVERLPSYFLYSLNEEWRTGRKLYQPILDSLDTPFAKSSDREWAWRAYNAWLRLQTDESSFDEAFSLRQVYVPLRAYYEDVTTKKATATNRAPRAKTVVDLQTELIKWLRTGRRDDAVRVISGGPGSGKSSFAKMFAAYVVEQEGLKALFIPLHLFDPTQDLVEEVGRFVENALPYNPLAADSREPRLLLIFDGLDELASQGKAANETARQFAIEIERTVSRRNSQVLRLQVIISGRELIVQGNELEFRKEHQILTLLPYLIERDSLGNEELVRDPHGIRGHDQRNDWWLQYGRISGKGYSGLPEHLKRQDLQEITAQPLLNYLVALSYTREKLDFSQDINLNEVYEDLVHAVYDRAYEKKRLHISIRDMEPNDFMRILEEVGLAAWHGNGRTTTVREITEHCKVSGLEEMLNKFEEGARAGVTRLLAAFFFRQHERNVAGDQTFVFTHKSFGEYLAARRIVRAISRITDEREANSKSPDSGWSEQEALVRWAKATGANPLTPYLIGFITNELVLRDLEYVRRIQACFAKLLSYVLMNGMPMEQLVVPTFKVQMHLARNCEEALLVCMNLCAKLTEELSLIIHPTRVAFANWYSRIVGQATDVENVLAANYLEYINLSGIDLTYLNLFGAELSYSNLQGSNLTFANMAYTDITGADFSRADLDDVNLTHSVFRECLFKGTDFLDTILSTTTFQFCELDKARFQRKADFESAHLLNTTAKGVRFIADEALARQLEMSKSAGLE